MGLQLSTLIKKTYKASLRLKSSIIRIALGVFRKNFLRGSQHVIRCKQLMRGDNARKELTENKTRLLLIVTGSNKRHIEQRNKEEEKKNKEEERRTREGDKKSMINECKRNNREEIK